MNNTTPMHRRIKEKSKTERTEMAPRIESKIFIID
jgi:hypothetical protein